MTEYENNNSGRRVNTSAGYLSLSTVGRRTTTVNGTAGYRYGWTVRGTLPVHSVVEPSWVLRPTRYTIVHFGDALSASTEQSPVSH